MSVYSKDRAGCTYTVQKLHGFNLKAAATLYNCHCAVKGQVALVSLNVIVRLDAVSCTFTRDQKLKTLVRLKPFNWDFAAGRTMLVRIDWNWDAGCVQKCYMSHVLKHERELYHIILE